MGSPRASRGSAIHVFLVTNKPITRELKGHCQLMHMRIRYHFLADLHVTRHERETESEKYPGILKTNLVELNNLQAQIVIIDLN